jgi:hypothetical protein
MAQNAVQGVLTYPSFAAVQIYHSYVLSLMVEKNVWPSYHDVLHLWNRRMAIGYLGGSSYCCSSALSARYGEFMWKHSTPTLLAVLNVWIRVTGSY